MFHVGWFQSVLQKKQKRGFWFGSGFHDKRIVNFFMTRVIWHDFHHC